ncbi:hypothetical protein FKM82_027180 [Ascaphus truei]
MTLRLALPTPYYGSIQFGLEWLINHYCHECMKAIVEQGAVGNNPRTVRHHLPKNQYWRQLVSQEGTPMSYESSGDGETRAWWAWG